MHIIKISSASFKIILTKEDVEKYSKKYVFEDKIDSLGFFCEIKDKTDLLFNCPFDKLNVSAEFFQSKDGGGELFLTATPKVNVHSCFFKTRDSDILFKLCKRMDKELHNCKSKLFYYEESYILFLSFESHPDELLLGVLSEYGDVFKCHNCFEWYLSEHAKCIFDGCAVSQIVNNLG